MTGNLSIGNFGPTPESLVLAALGLSVLLTVTGLWLLWRVKRILGTLPMVEERLNAVMNSTSLLTDTTEACFKAISIQLQAMHAGAAIQARTVAELEQMADESPARAAAPAVSAATAAATAFAASMSTASPVATPPMRMPTPAEVNAQRQGRVVGAAQRGERVANIAASEDVAEAEVALRLHLKQSLGSAFFQQLAAEGTR